MRLDAYGVSVDAPDGWEVRITRRAPEGHEPGAHRRPVLHAATVPLPAVRGDFGGGVTGTLTSTDVFVSLFEQDPGAARTALFADEGFPVPVVSDFAPNRLQRSIPGQCGGQWFFHVGERAFTLYVVFGSFARRAELFNRLTPLLRSVRLQGDLT
ncbi:hypothetical protein [Kineococcus rhizosphaerae]|uniref:Uncharacterized protein n=1 Tax=Kineococcus rhizosphaerae TaxID=559628 RepID=A0A2T0R7U6_9ACTN|nr:hypothetical protein [Kineococcus rhizosphaerae]PRY17243.1 hypothetical protein CLV37_102202 [Kineococcus rhizosphaerae]